MYKESPSRCRKSTDLEAQMIPGEVQLLHVSAFQQHPTNGLCPGLRDAAVAYVKLGDAYVVSQGTCKTLRPLVAQIVLAQAQL